MHFNEFKGVNSDIYRCLRECLVLSIIVEYWQSKVVDFSNLNVKVRKQGFGSENWV